MRIVERKLDTTLKVLFISDTVPTLYGPISRLLYDILWANDELLEVDFSVIGKEMLNVDLPPNIHFIKWSDIPQKEKKSNSVYNCLRVKRIWTRLSRIHIDATRYDCIVLFPYYLGGLDIDSKVSKYEIIAMDSTTMCFNRAIINHKSLLFKLLSSIRLYQSINIERICAKRANNIYVVGDSDAKAYEVFFNKHAIYVPHPVTNEVRPYYNGAGWNGKDRLKICIAGTMDFFYSGHLYRDVINEFANSDLNNEVEFFFLGQNNKYIDTLTKAGYAVSQIDFVPSYEEFLAKMHILIAPILVGSGTKNRVLSALGVGVDVIGSPIAVENVFGIEDDNVAYNASMYVKRVEERLANRKLHNYSSKKIEGFMEYHSRNKWRELFWENLVNKSYED